MSVIRGWATSKILSTALAPYVARRLQVLNPSELRDGELVKGVFDSAFTELDNEIITDAMDAMNSDIPHAEAMCRIAPASSGSCATLAMLDPTDLLLYVACAGDSRAVLGRRTGDKGRWATMPLSVDQTGFNPDEISRITDEEPGETPIDLESGRVLKCAVTRSFGDNRWKWPSEKLEKWQNQYFGREPLANYHTPPYLTAKPVVQSAKVTPGDFLILASDGFWNHMESNEDAVHLVSLWLEEKRSKEMKKDGEASDWQSNPEDPRNKSSYGKSPAGYPYNWTIPRANFVVEEKNLATHLVRNAFGGILRDLFCSVMSTSPPDSKETRDDVTVIVVLF